MANIKLKFKVQEPASFFHFLDSISQWNIHTRIRIREYYEKKFGISKEDEGFIKKYIVIRKKYPWRILDSDFIPAKDFNEVKTNLKKRLTKKEFLEMNEIIKHFYPPIHKIYFEWYKLHKKGADLFEKEVKKLKIDDIFKEIRNFYESGYTSNTIFVHLVINPTGNSLGGGANVYPHFHITIEPPNLHDKSPRTIKHVLGFIVHEALHLIESEAPKEKWEEFKNKTLDKKLNFSVLREAIAETIAPYGVLAKEHGLDTRDILSFKNARYPKKKDSGSYCFFNTIKRKLSAYIYPLTEKQIKNKMSIFEGNYIDDCIKEFQKIQKHIKR